MKKIVYFLIASTLILTGCAATKNVIPPLNYKDEIKIHVPKKSYIYWVPGKQVSSEAQSYPYAASNPGGSGIAGAIGTLVVSMVADQYRKTHRSEYTNEYGKADEVIFLTSLKDTLEKHNVFKEVELTNDLTKVHSRDVLIKIHFKTTRVVKDSRDYRDLITLAVNLSLKTGQKPLYIRDYLIQSEAYTSKSFFEKKTEVSQQLLVEIINSIEQWGIEKK